MTTWTVDVQWYPAFAVPLLAFTVIIAVTVDRLLSPRKSLGAPHLTPQSFAGDVESHTTTRLQGTLSRLARSVKILAKGKVGPYLDPELASASEDSDLDDDINAPLPSSALEAFRMDDIVKKLKRLETMNTFTQPPPPSPSFSNFTPGDDGLPSPPKAELPPLIADYLQQFQEPTNVTDSNDPMRSNVKSPPTRPRSYPPKVLPQGQSSGIPRRTARFDTSPKRMPPPPPRRRQTYHAQVRRRRQSYYGNTVSREIRDSQDMAISIAAEDEELKDSEHPLTAERLKDLERPLTAERLKKTQRRRDAQSSTMRSSYSHGASEMGNIPSAFPRVKKEKQIKQTVVVTQPDGPNQMASKILRFARNNSGQRSSRSTSMVTGLTGRGDVGLSQETVDKIPLTKDKSVLNWRNSESIIESTRVAERKGEMVVEEELPVVEETMSAKKGKDKEIGEEKVSGLGATYEAERKDSTPAAIFGPQRPSRHAITRRSKISFDGWGNSPFEGIDEGSAEEKG